MPSQKPLNFESPAPRPVHRGTMGSSRDHRADLPIEDWRSSLMEKKIDLYNFEGCAAEESSYILTSPRSLRACARMKIQPVELLAKPETDFEEELLTSGQQPGEASRKLYDAHERARLRKLYMCRRAREEIIQEDGGDERIEVIDNAKLLFQGMNKPPERTLKHTANGIDHSRVIIPKSGQGNSNLRPGASPRPPSHPPTRPPHSRSSATSKTSSTSSPRTPKTRSSGSTPSSGGRRNPNPGDLPPRLLKRSASMPPTSRQRPQSAVSSGSSHRSSRTPLSQRLVLDGERPSRSSSRSRPYSANLPERDQRILDCMVFKREQEQDELRHQRVASKVWDEERRKEEKIRMENELQRRKNLVERELDRQKKRDRMQKQRDKEEKEKLKEFEMSLKYKDAKHVQMASQQDLLKIQQIDIKKQAEKTKKEKQAKALQEKEAKDEVYRRMAEKHSVLSLESAEAKRENKQQEEVRELQRKNKEVMQQHAVRKKVIDKKTEEENEYQRMCIDAKDSKHKDMIEQQQFQRQTELRNSRRKLEQQQKKASKTKVVLDTNLEKWKDDIVKHRTVVQEQAVVKAEKVVQEKAQKAQELRIVKEKTHKERIARVAEDAEALARFTEQKIKHKDQKVEGVIAKKQQEIDKSRAVAQNSAKLREQIRNQYTKSFDCMAKKAELESKLGAGPSLGTKNYSHVIIS